ncbi:MAG: alpha-L-fucosidase, partial [Candidatus Thorarchaeota archaeon]
NNRWNQYIPEEKKFRYIKHYDFTTPEYEVEKKIKKKKWEVCRGIGNSFGYNRYETEEDYLSATEIIYMLVDIVSKNGNLLLNVGPTAEGKIPEIQKQRLLELGEWLEVNGDAIFNTRPWSRAEGTTTGGIPVRFTRNKDILYAILLGKPEKEEILINDLGGEEISQVNLLGVKENLVWRPEGNDLFIKIPNSIQHSPAISFKIAFK